MRHGSTLFFLVLTIFLWINTYAWAHWEREIPDANDMINSNEDLIVLDVRESASYCDTPLGHIPGALNYPWNSGYLQANYQDFPLDAEILVVCHSGGRSHNAANFLDGEGYLYVYDMTGGTYDWKYEYGYGTVGCVDSDSDGINDDLDNCSADYNPSQTDSDDDGTGNPCDENCPNLDNQNPVNLIDFSTLESNWLKTGPNLPGDLNGDGGDGIVNIIDLIIFIDYWLSDCFEQ